MSVKTICGNLLEADTQYIAHQCNCLTLKGANLSKIIFSTFPYADIYKTRVRKHWKESRDKPGNIIIKGNGEDKRYVINMLGQLFPGSPRYPDSVTDGYKSREKYFKECLTAILEEIPNLKSIAFPWKIGCGMAGGDWNIYFKMIEDFSNCTKGDVFIYRRVEDGG